MNKRVIAHSIIVFISLIILVQFILSTSVMLEWFLLTPLLFSETLTIIFLMWSLFIQPRALNKSIRIFLLSIITSWSPFFILLFLPIQSFHFTNPMLFIAVFLLVMGYFLSVISVIQLNDGFTLLPEANKLVTRGIYGISRHPYYIGQILIFTALIILTQSYITLIMSWLFIFIIMIRIKKEEEVLKRKFPSYYVYQKKVGLFGKKF